MSKAKPHVDKEPLGGVENTCPKCRPYLQGILDALVTMGADYKVALQALTRERDALHAENLRLANRAGALEADTRSDLHPRLVEAGRLLTEMKSHCEYATTEFRDDLQRVIDLFIVGLHETFGTDESELVTLFTEQE